MLIQDKYKLAIIYDAEKFHWPPECLSVQPYNSIWKKNTCQEEVRY